MFLYYNFFHSFPLKKSYIMIFSDAEAEIYGNNRFLCGGHLIKPQDGCHDIIGRGGSYKKCEPKTMRSLWKKIDFPVWYIHIHPKCVIKLPDLFTCVKRMRVIVTNLPLKNDCCRAKNTEHLKTIQVEKKNRTLLTTGLDSCNV